MKKTKKKIAKIKKIKINKHLTQVKSIQQKLKSTKIELENIKQNVKMIAELMDDYVYLIDKKMRIQYLNKSAAKKLKLSVKKITGKHLNFLFPSIIAEKKIKLIKKVLQTKKINIDEHSSFFPGQNAWLSTQLLPIKNEKNEVICILGIARDITERKLIMAKLLESEYKYRNLLEALPVTIFEADLNFNITFVTNIGLKTFGYTHKDFQKGVNVLEVLIPEDREKCFSHVKRIMNGEILDYSEYTAIRKNSTTFPVMVKSQRILKDNKPVGIRGIMIDLTERKKAEEEIHKHENQLAVALRSIGDGVIMTDINSNITLVNRTAELLTGYKQEEAIGKHISSVFNIIDEKTRVPKKNACEIAIQTKEIYVHSLNTVLIDKKEDEKIITCICSPVKDQNDDIFGAILTFNDITEKIKTDEELQKIQKLESLGLLAGGIAHDFNNFLTSIMGNIDIIKMEFNPEDKIYQRLKSAEMAAEKAVQLTQQLLTFSKGGEPVKRKILLGNLIPDIINMCLSGSNVKCNINFDKDLWPIEADEGQISQVINNILINAKQSMPEGVDIEVTVSNITVYPQNITHFLPGDYIKMNIKDHGKGIPEPDIKKIFDPFFTTKINGTGLGLAIAYSIIQKHSGYITVKSELNKGTTFSVYLPAYKNN